MTTTTAGTTASRYRTPEDKRKSELLYDLEDHVATMDRETVLIGDGDIERISSILGQNRNSNLIYYGKSGLGKSASINGIARRKLDTINGTLEEGEKRLPLHMIDRRYLVLDTDVLFGKNDPDVIERDIQNIFNELEKPGDHVLVIEDANQWLKGIEDNQVQGLISTFMRELKKGAFQAVLMVRDEPGKRNLSDVMGCHSEMSELFTILEKKPPGKEEVLEIMARSKSNLESHHDGLHITDEANAEIVNLTFLYPNLRIYLQEQPSRSLRMRDQIASTFVSRMQSRPKELDDLEAKLENTDATLLKSPEDAAALAEKSELLTKIAEINEIWEKRAHDLGKVYRDKRNSEKDIAEYEGKIAKLTDELREKFIADKGREPSEADIATLKTPDIKEAEKFLRMSREELDSHINRGKALKAENNDELTLNVSDVRGLFGEISGIPAKDLNANEAAKALTLGTNMKDKVFGQDEAIDVIDSAIKRTKAGLKDPSKPIGSFIMLGSSGIGKSYMAEVLAEELYDDKDSITVFDMSEFMEKHTVSRFIGAPPGYAGYGEGGALVNAVRRKPYQVILLDEVEKAHPDVFKVLLQVLDKGRLSDELGTGDFRNVVFIMTTNLGQNMSYDANRTSANSEADIKDELRKIFPQELINRIDSPLLLKAHKPENIERIVGRDLSTLNKRLKERDIEVSLSKEDISKLVEDRYKPEEGARQVQKFVTAKLTGKVADIVLAHSNEAGVIVATYDPDGEDFALDFKPKVVEMSPVQEVAANVSTPAPVQSGGGAGFGTAASAAWQKVVHAAPVYAPMMA
jgi:ATP-dependent Clp protease ATP-binding subunit ClpB